VKNVKESLLGIFNEYVKLISYIYDKLSEQVHLHFENNVYIYFIRILSLFVHIAK